MRSIKWRFEKIAKQQPNASSLIVFAEAIAKEGFSKDRLRRAFNRLVDIDDFDSSDKRRVLANLEKLNGPRSIPKIKANTELVQGFTVKPIYVSHSQKILVPA
jgi:hypothetical protein